MRRCVGMGAIAVDVIFCDVCWWVGTRWCSGLWSGLRCMLVGICFGVCSVGSIFGLLCG